MKRDYLKSLTTSEQAAMLRALDKSDKVEFLKCIEFSNYVSLAFDVSQEELDMMIDILIENNRHVELFRMVEVLPKRINLKIINFFIKREENSFKELSEFLTNPTLTDEEKSLIKTGLLKHYDFEDFPILANMFRYQSLIDGDYKKDLLNVFLQSKKDVEQIRTLFYLFRSRSMPELLNILIVYIVNELPLEMFRELVKKNLEMEQFLYDYIIDVAPNKAFLFKRFKSERIQVQSTIQDWSATQNYLELSFCAIKKWTFNHNDLELSVYANFILNGLNGSDEEIALLDYKYNELLKEQENVVQLNSENQGIARR